MTKKNTAPAVDVALDVPPTFRELLLEQLRFIREALPDDRTVQDWYDDGCDFDEFSFSDPQGVDREAVSFAFGYLRGAHEAMDITMLEMFENEGINIANLETEH